MQEQKPGKSQGRKRRMDIAGPRKRKTTYEWIVPEKLKIRQGLRVGCDFKTPRIQAHNQHGDGVRCLDDV